MIPTLAPHQRQRQVGKSKVIKHLISGVQIKYLNVGEMTLGKGNLTAKCRELPNFSQQI